MKKEITVNAKTIEEAVARAAEELGVAVDKIEYTVTTEPKKGFLGIGATFAEIVATTEQAPDNKATAFIKTVVEDMGIEAEVNTKYGDNGGVVIEITGDDAGVLIGHHGETLDALQYLAGLAANRREIGENGEKMSKSRGNVVNPDDVVNEYGADTLRLYEMFLGPLEFSKPWDTQGIDGVYKFLRKFWRLFQVGEDFSVSDETPSREELKVLHKTIKKVSF